MGRHSLLSKRNKRRKQKKQRRDKVTHQEVSSCSSSAPSCSSEQEEYTLDDFYTALDRIGDENLNYWNEHQESMESYKDVHPAVICDEKNGVEVYIRGAHKGMTGLNRVSIEHYMKTIQDKEMKSQRLCKFLRDRIEDLESELEEAKLKAEVAKRDGIKSIEQVRTFWRNKIFEEASLGGRMVMNSIRKTSQ